MEDGDEGLGHRVGHRAEARAEAGAEEKGFLHAKKDEENAAGINSEVCQVSPLALLIEAEAHGESDLVGDGVTEGIFRRSESPFLDGCDSRGIESWVT